MNIPEIIETDRLRLRKPEVADAEAVFTGYAQDPVVTRYLIWLPHKDIGETRAFISRCLDCWTGDKTFSWVITDKTTSELLGMIEIRLDGHTVNLGYVLKRVCWRKGIMPEAAKAIVDWAMSQREIYRVWAICDVENHASARVLEKVGMQREGIFRRMIMHPTVSDEPRDALCYAIVK